MITFTCDRCNKTIDAKNEIRFMVSIEVQAALGSDETVVPSEHLDELNKAFGELDCDEQAEITHQVYEKRSFDLCDSCREQYGKNLLGTETAASLNFSDN
jgi:ABC-type thiamine transport system substrate-binding protein